MTDEQTPADDTEANAGGDTWRTAANVMGVLVLVALVLPFVVYAVPQVVGADASYVVLSGSMEPTFGPGDVIVVEEVPPSTIAKDDVITFTRANERTPTTHRVVEVVETEQGLAFRTEGDANEGPDPSLVPAAQVQGQVPTVGGYLFVIPLVGYVIRFAGTTTGIVTLLVAPLALLVLSEAYVLARSTSDGDGSDADEETPGERSASDGDAGSTTAAGGAATTEPNRDATADATGGEDEAGGITLTPMDPRLTVGGLTLFTAYAVWVAVTTREVWSVTAATTVGATLVLVGAMYLFGGSTSDGSTDDAPAATAPPAPRRRVAEDGGTESATARAATPRARPGDAVLRTGPLDGAAPGGSTPESRDGTVTPRTATGPAEPAVEPVGGGDGDD
jgi:signal peptidase